MAEVAVSPKIFADILSQIAGCGDRPHLHEWRCGQIY
jgi:hypothetical protein